MRNRWEAGAKDELDEPATITERQLRSLRRGARAGTMAILLAFLATGAAVLALVMGPEALAGIDGVQDVKEKLLSAIGRPVPVEIHQAAQSPPRDSLWLPDTSRGTDSTRTASIAPRVGD